MIELQWQSPATGAWYKQETFALAESAEWKLAYVQSKYPRCAFRLVPAVPETDGPNA